LFFFDILHPMSHPLPSPLATELGVACHAHHRPRGPDAARVPPHLARARASKVCG
jgi:hypothetical protein